MLEDLRLAFRLLWRDRAFSAVAVFTLALGIGASTAIFSVVDRVLLRPAPVEDIDRLALVWETDRDTGTTREPASVPDFLDFEAGARSFGELAALMAGERNLTPPDGEAVRLATLGVTHDLLPMLGVRLLAGRGFTEEEDRPNGPRVAVISASLWERLYGRDPDALGTTLQVDEQPYIIVGVAPDAADFGVLQILGAAAYSRGFADRGDRVRVDLWLPLQADPAVLVRDTHPILVLGRLAPGATIASAQREMTALAAALERDHRSNAGRGVYVEGLSDVVFGPTRPALLVLLGAVAFVLLIACVNVANLLLARGETRVREVAVRSALGGGRARLARQFLVENLTLVLVAAAGGVALAVVLLRGLVALAPADIPRVGLVAVDWRVLGATLATSLVVGLIFGMVPTWHARRVDLQAALQGARHSAGPRRGRVRAALVVTQVALAVVLLVGAGLLAKSFWQLGEVDAGFRAAGVLKAEYQLPRTRYPADFSRWPDFKEMHAFTAALQRGAAVLPGVEAAAVAGNHPLDPGFTNSFTIVGREAESRTWPEISIRRVSPGYFRTVGLALVRGRLLSERDTTDGAPVVLVNEAAARRFFGDADPIGAEMRFWGASRRIVGIVANERFQGLAQTPPIAAYAPLAQAPSANGAGVLLLRTARDPLALASDARTLVRGLDPALAVFGVEPLEETVSRSVSARRFTMLLLVSFAAVALVLAATGIHGLLSFGVARRTAEIGIRMAVGAHPRHILRLIVGEGILLGAAGLAAGIAGAVVLTRLLANLLFGVAPTDPLTFGSVALFLGLVAVGASYLPARRAARIDPAVSLRNE